MKLRSTILSLIAVAGLSCHPDKPPQPPAPVPTALTVKNIWLDAEMFNSTIYGASVRAAVKIQFSTKLDKSTVGAAVSFTDAYGDVVPYTPSYLQGDSVLVITPSANMKNITKQFFALSTSLKSAQGTSLLSALDRNFITRLDSTRKFPTLTNDQLLDKVQQQTFKYFWDFGHPVSGLARERNTSGEVVTSGGSGFGVMAIVTAVSRGFITRAQGLARMQTIVSFLKNTAQTFHGAYPHWLNGTTGVVVPFSTKDNGADLVETSYLMQGLLCARQFFSDAGTAESTLRADINTIYNRVEWSWFRKNNENVLYWHWSPNYAWDMNMPIRGWNECLITYVMAASSTNYGIPASVYTSGWAGATTGFANGNTYLGYTLPLGQSYGGPLFFSHYSFLGINPNGLSDAYANYATQTRNHTLINYSYCKSQPSVTYGYSDSIWGLTACDIPNGYSACSPTNDLGVVAPTAALSSFPYTPTQSMAALQFYYYVLGDKIWKDYGFVDAFSLGTPWFASSFLAIDQGPIIIQIENYRTGLLWNLFTSCPEVKNGMRTLGFTAPYL